MSYNDLSSIKKINGIPVDLNYFTKAIENDSFFKASTDADEDMLALDRDIIPLSTNIYKIGSSSKYFISSYIKTLNSEVLNLLGGTLSSPSLIIGSVGLASINSGELSITASSNEALKIASSGTRIKAANNFQLAIENTLPGSLGTWYIGSDSTGVRIASSTDVGSNKLVIGSSSTESFNKVKIPIGTALAPSLSFTGDNTTGIYKTSSSELNFCITGNDALKIDSSKVTIANSLLNIPSGSSTVPGLGFTEFANTGLSGKSLTEIGFIFNGIQNIILKNNGYLYSAQDSASYSHSLASNIFGNSFNIYRSRGTINTPSGILNGDVIGEFKFQGASNLNTSVIGASIFVQAEEDFTSTSSKSAIYFNTTDTGNIDTTNQMVIGQSNKSDVFCNTGFGLNKILHTTTGTGLEIDVRHISKIIIDATAGNIEFKGFSGGKEGQLLYIYKKVPNNTFKIVFNSSTATQKVLLKGSVDYQNTNDYGGITLSFDDGIWREVSRS